MRLRKYAIKMFPCFDRLVNYKPCFNSPFQSYKKIIYTIQLPKVYIVHFELINMDYMFGNRKTIRNMFKALE